MDKQPNKQQKYMSNYNSNASDGIGFCGLLTIVFITLKLIDKIDWSWWWVLSPLWIPFCLVFGTLGIALLLGTLFFLGKKLPMFFKQMRKKY